MALTRENGVKRVGLPQTGDRRPIEAINFLGVLFQEKID
jgi:hypothetical protein